MRLHAEVGFALNQEVDGSGVVTGNDKLASRYARLTEITVKLSRQRSDRVTGMFGIKVFDRIDNLIVDRLGQDCLLSSAYRTLRPSTAPMLASRSTG